MNNSNLSFVTKRTGPASVFREPYLGRTIFSLIYNANNNVSSGWVEVANRILGHFHINETLVK